MYLYITWFDCRFVIFESFNISNYVLAYYILHKIITQYYHRRISETSSTEHLNGKQDICPDRLTFRMGEKKRAIL